MVLPSPDLDDRRFDDLVAEAKELARKACPQWNVDGVGDPGVMLLELFAFLTETMLFRLNRIPEKVQVELLRLIGVCLQAPAAASVDLVFTREEISNERMVIPQGYAVASSQSDPDGEPIVFTTVQPAVIEAGAASVSVPALHARWHAGMVIGQGTGEAGLELHLPHAPIIADSGFDDVVLGTIMPPDFEPVDQLGYRYQEGRWYRLWTPVSSFSDCKPADTVFVVDRMAGSIGFAPALRTEQDHWYGGVKALAAVPPAGADIRAWYRSGGGPFGNVPADSITVAKEPLPGISVSNPAPAMGGGRAENMREALIRGPLELTTLQRAITAGDFELLACKATSGIDRAHAYATVSRWPAAAAGTVTVVITPKPGPEAASLDRLQLEAHHSDRIREQVEEDLDRRRPIGTRCVVRWCRYKTVAVRARVVCERDRDPSTVQHSIGSALNQLLCPITGTAERPWPWGRTLHSSLIFGVITAQAGVRFVDGAVELLLDEAPETQVTDIDQDCLRPGTYFACSGSTLFRSTDDGGGWEVVYRAGDGMDLRQVACHPWHSGVLAVLVRGVVSSEAGSHRQDRIFISTDYGESWQADAAITARFEIEDLAWLPDAEPHLILATDVGLYRLRVGQVPVQIILTDENDEDSSEPTRGFYAVTTARDAVGATHVVAAAQGRGGIYHSADAGDQRSFTAIGLTDATVRHLAIQVDGSRLYCWAGLAALGRQQGAGARRFNLGNRAAGWTDFADGWLGGSCTNLQFAGDTIIASSHHAGIQILQIKQAELRWTACSIACGLPIREDSQELQTIDSLAIVNSDDGVHIVSCGPDGMARAFWTGGSAKSLRFERCGQRIDAERISLPQDWLFCAGSHAIEVVHAAEP